MKTWAYLYIFAFSSIISLFLTLLIKRIALRLGIVDHPGERKLHFEPKPLLGGLSLYISFIITILINLLLVFYFKDTLLLRLLPAVAEQITKIKLLLLKISVILIGATFITILGLFDDLKRKSLSYKPKLILQFIISSFVVILGIKISFLKLEILNIIFSILWIVLITNSFNLLDNMDGLSAGIGLISGLILLFLVLQQQQHFTGFMLLALVGGLAGFLPLNFYPAKIFLGDAGSLFIGFMLASITIIASYITPKTPSLLFPLIMPILILSVPLFDTLSVIYIRLREKRSIFKGDMSHFSHRLLRLGMTQRQVVLFIYLVSIGVGISSTLLANTSNIESIIILIQAIIIFILIGILMLVAKLGIIRNLNKKDG
jgi:UDP-GlcNAc:undecaprenyl-phosphate GlcNAc-1-phosphate transferase